MLSVTVPLRGFFFCSHGEETWYGPYENTSYRPLTGVLFLFSAGILGAIDGKTYVTVPLRGFFFCSPCLSDWSLLLHWQVPLRPKSIFSILPLQKLRKSLPLAIFSQRLDDDNFFDATSSIDANVVDLAVGREFIAAHIVL